MAQSVGAPAADTVQSSTYGGDGGQLLVNEAAQAIADGTYEIVLVTGAEAGATMAAAQRAGTEVGWPQQGPEVEPTRIAGIDKEANNAAETAVGLGAPIYVYALMESANRHRLGRDPKEHLQAIGELWARLSAVGADNPNAWLPRRFGGPAVAQQQLRPRFGTAGRRRAGAVRNSPRWRYHVRRQPAPSVARAPTAAVLVERRGPIMIITMNRPEVRNAVDHAMALGLEKACDAFEADPNARVTILTGADGYFSSGMDPKAMARGEAPLTEKRGALGLAGKPPRKPLIAAAGGVMRLRERLPRNIAMQLALTGDPMQASRLAELGLINVLAEPGQALTVALELAERIAVNAPLSLEGSKRIVEETSDWTTAEAFAEQYAIASTALFSEDAAEGVRAFTEKRAPVWNGR